MTDTGTETDTGDPAHERKDATAQLDSFRIGETLVLFDDDDDRWIRSDAAVDLAEVR